MWLMDHSAGTCLLVQIWSLFLLVYSLLTAVVLYVGNSKAKENRYEMLAPLMSPASLCLLQEHQIRH